MSQRRVTRHVTRHLTPRATHHTRTLAALSAASVLALAACSAPGSGGSAATTEDTGEVSTEVTEDVTLTMFDGSGFQDYDAALIAAFEAEHPNITIEQRIEPDNVITTTFPRVIASDTPPDLVRPYSGALVEHAEDGLMTDLDPYAEAYGWDELPEAQLAPYRVADGARGSGDLFAFGVPAGPMTGVFVNREVAARIGMTEVPATLDELEAVMDDAKAAGVTPMIVANKIGLLGHVWNLLLGQYAGAQAVNDVGFRVEGASVDTPEALEATERLRSWVDAGYVNEDLNALDQDPSYARFMNGEALFTVQGSWVLDPLEPMVEAGNLGFFPMPPAEADGAATAMSSAGLTFGIPAKSQNHDAAAVFLDWLQSDEAAEIAYENGFSAQAPDATPEVAPLDADVRTQLSDGYAHVVAEDGVSSWIVDATAGLATSAVNPGLQQLAGGQIEPAAFLEQVQDAYESEIGR